jgi:hypothetical protein
MFLDEPLMLSADLRWSFGSQLAWLLIKHSPELVEPDGSRFDQFGTGDEVTEVISTRYPQTNAPPGFNLYATGHRGPSSRAGRKRGAAEKTLQRDPGSAIKTKFSAARSRT